jgi:hypothetical protein
LKKPFVQSQLKIVKTGLRTVTIPHNKNTTFGKLFVQIKMKSFYCLWVEITQLHWGGDLNFVKTLRIIWKWNIQQFYSQRNWGGMTVFWNLICCRFKWPRVKMTWNFLSFPQVVESFCFVVGKWILKWPFEFLEVFFEKFDRLGKGQRYVELSFILDLHFWGVFVW